MGLLKVKNIKKIYATRFGNQKVEALKNVSLEVEQGEYVAIMGESGSGKTTLADKLVESFGRDEVSILRHDNYYKRHDDIPFE